MENPIKGGGNFAYIGVAGQKARMYVLEEVIPPLGVTCSYGFL